MQVKIKRGGNKLGSLAFIFAITVIPMIILAIFLINGKGSFLIAGYNTMSKHRKEKYDKFALCRFTGWLLIVISVCIFILFLGIYFQKSWLTYCGIGLIIVVPICAAIYMNISKHFRNKEVVFTENKEPLASSKKTIIAILTSSAVVVIGIIILLYSC